VAGLLLEEDRLLLGVGRARGGRLQTVDFVEEVPSAGLRRGGITDAGLFADALDRLVQTLEEVTRSSPLHRIVCGVHGPLAEIQFLTRSVEVPEGHPLTEEEVDLLLHETAERAAEGRVLLQVMPWGYVLDQHRETDRPWGLRAQTITLEALGVYADRAPFADFQEVFEELGLRGAELVLASIAASRTCLTPDERRDGVVLVEFAWDECRVSVFSRDRLYLHRATEAGLGALAEELALAMGMSPADARALIPRLRFDRKMDDALFQVGRRFLAETLDAAQRFLDESLRGMQRPPSVMGWVLTGLLADAAGTPAFAARHLGCTARTAHPGAAFRIPGHEGSQVTALMGLLDCAAGEVPRLRRPLRPRALDRMGTLSTRLMRKLRPSPIVPDDRG
jgi:cell division ATPase FtsA